MVSSLKLSMATPCPVYRDEIMDGSALAQRPSDLEGKTVVLIPNWRPAAVHILRAIGITLQERFRLKEVILEKPVRVAPMTKGGTLLDSMRGQLDDLAKRGDVAVVASGD